MKRVLVVAAFLTGLAGVVVMALWFDSITRTPKTDEEQILEIFEEWVEALAERDYEAAWELTDSNIRSTSESEVEPGGSPKKHFVAILERAAGNWLPVRTDWRILEIQISPPTAWIITIAGEDGCQWGFTEEDGEWRTSSWFSCHVTDWEEPDVDLPFFQREIAAPWRRREVSQVLTLLPGKVELPAIETDGPIILRADMRLSWGEVVTAIETVAVAGVGEIGLGGSPSEYLRCVPRRPEDRIPFFSVERKVSVTLPAKEREYPRVVVVDIPAGLGKGFERKPVWDLFRTLAEEHPDVSVILNAPAGATWAEVARVLDAVAVPIVLVARPGDAPKAFRLNGLPVEEAATLGLPSPPQSHPALEKTLRRP